jgi:hypothetical protein
VILAYHVAWSNTSIKLQSSHIRHNISKPPWQKSSSLNKSQNSPTKVHCCGKKEGKNKRKKSEDKSDAIMQTIPKIDTAIRTPKPPHWDPVIRLCGGGHIECNEYIAVANDGGKPLMTIMVSRIFVGTEK